MSLNVLITAHCGPEIKFFGKANYIKRTRDIDMEDA